MLKKFWQLCLGTLLCSAAIAMEEKPMRDTGLFGVLPIKTYDTSNVPNENLIDGFLDHCCTFPQKFRYEDENVSKTLQIEHDTLIVNKRQFGTVARIFAKDELSKYLGEISKFSTGKKLIEVIYSEYIKNPELSKVPFLEVLDCDEYGIGTATVLFPPLHEWRIPIDKKELKLAIKLFDDKLQCFYRHKDRTIELAGIGFDESLVHEMVHWKDFLTQSSQEMYDFIKSSTISNSLIINAIPKNLKENFKTLVYAVLDPTFKLPLTGVHLAIESCNPTLSYVLQSDPTLVEKFNSAVGESTRLRRYSDVLLDVNDWLDDAMEIIFRNALEMSAVYGIQFSNYQVVAYDPLNESEFLKNRKGRIRANYAALVKSETDTLFEQRKAAMMHVIELIDKNFGFYSRYFSEN